MSTLDTVPGAITAPQGFRAVGIHAGIKKSTAPDLALIVSETDAAIAGVFTSNRVQGAHVRLCKERLTTNRTARAIVINSGNANACTGPQGLEHARRTALTAAEALGVDEQSVLVCSTGPIGIPLPIDILTAGIRKAVPALSVQGGVEACRAIMTTDTFDKQTVTRLSVDGVTITLGGMAKGAGMIEPNMATMLAFLTTDAAVEPGALQQCLNTAVAGSFNRISVDGDQSCNDTVLLLANGRAGNKPLGPNHPAWSSFCAAVNELTLYLALRIVEDGEGATKIVTVRVQGALTAADAEKAVRAIANSLLVKTSWHGGDPNWGRVIDAVGYSGAEMKEELVEIRYDNVPAVLNGQAAPGFTHKALEEVLRRKRFTVLVDLHLGHEDSTVFTCDCSEEYVRINSEYLT